MNEKASFLVEKFESLKFFVLSRLPIKLKERKRERERERERGNRSDIKNPHLRLRLEPFITNLDLLSQCVNEDYFLSSWRAPI